jgi:SAM-dependent methyltransferase
MARDREVRDYPLCVSAAPFCKTEDCCRRFVCVSLVVEQGGASMTQGILTAPDHTEATRAQWDMAAEGWDAQSPALKGWLAGPTGTMAELAGVREGSLVLDVAAGAGDQTLALAARVGQTGRILATDLSPALVERLGQNVARAGLVNVEARVADAQEPLPEREQFDAAICRLGLMLMESPARAIGAVHAALRPGGSFAAMVFAGPDANPCLRTVVATALRHAGLPPRDPFAPGSLFSLGRSGELEGFERVSIRVRSRGQPGTSEQSSVAATIRVRLPGSSRIGLAD